MVVEATYFFGHSTPSTKASKAIVANTRLKATRRRQPSLTSTGAISPRDASSPPIRVASLRFLECALGNRDDVSRLHREIGFQFALLQDAVEAHRVGLGRAIGSLAIELGAVGSCELGGAARGED